MLISKTLFSLFWRGVSESSQSAHGVVHEPPVVNVGQGAVEWKKYHSLTRSDRGSQTLYDRLSISLHSPDLVVNATVQYNMYITVRITHSWVYTVIVADVVVLLEKAKPRARPHLHVLPHDSSPVNESQLANRFTYYYFNFWGFPKRLWFNWDTILLKIL